MAPTTPTVLPIVTSKTLSTRLANWMPSTSLVWTSFHWPWASLNSRVAILNTINWDCKLHQLKKTRRMEWRPTSYLLIWVHFRNWQMLQRSLIWTIRCRLRETFVGPRSWTRTCRLSRNLDLRHRFRSLAWVSIRRSTMMIQTSIIIPSSANCQSAVTAFKRKTVRTRTIRMRPRMIRRTTTCLLYSTPASRTGNSRKRRRRRPRCRSRSKRRRPVQLDSTSSTPWPSATRSSRK